MSLASIRNFDLKLTAYCSSFDPIIGLTTIASNPIPVILCPFKSLIRVNVVVTLLILHCCTVNLSYSSDTSANNATVAAASVPS